MPHRKLSEAERIEQEQAVSLLETANVHGKITPDLKQRIISLGDHVRLDVKEALDAESAKRRADRIMSTLRGRFDSAGIKLRNAVDWSDFAKTIRLNSESLSILQRLERAGLEPHLAGVEGNEYIIRHSANGKDKGSGQKVSVRVKKYEE